MHAEALSAAVDAWLDEIRDECDLEVEGREYAHGGVLLRLQMDDNPLEEYAGTTEMSINPPRDGRTRALFLGTGQHGGNDLHFAYYDMQHSYGEHVDISDNHRMLVWFGTAPSETAADAVRSAYEDGVIDGVLDHLISIDRLVKALRGTTPLGPAVVDRLTLVNRRMA